MLESRLQIRFYKPFLFGDKKSTGGMIFASAFWGCVKRCTP